MGGRFPRRGMTGRYWEVGYGQGRGGKEGREARREEQARAGEGWAASGQGEPAPWGTVNDKEVAPSPYVVEFGSPANTQQAPSESGLQLCITQGAVKHV